MERLHELHVAEPQRLEPKELPLADPARSERADAAANRRRILAAADRLFAHRSVEQVSMDDVAAAAGVGKGTLFRRFGDRQGLLLALLDESERALQEAILRGPPPLGPGAPPRARLDAFATALIDLLEERGGIVRASESSAPGARLRGGAYGAWHHHLAVLLEQLGAAEDPDALAHILLAPLAADLYRSLREDHGFDRARFQTALERLWGAAVGSSENPAD
jgi:AcrR family transcriptional regulator